MLSNSIDVFNFSKGLLSDIVQGASGRGVVAAPRQVTYLADYCEQLETRTIVREGHYVDRHYIDEYALYYARMLNPPRNTVERLHIFAESFGNAELNAWFAESLQSEDHRKEIEERVQRSYLGFVSVRPLPSVPVGRTVLRRLPDAERKRDIWATTRHHVHLANLNLSVDGLAFQQQDVGVGACATTALWCALSHVARGDGMRAPTPAEVAEAATSSLPRTGRALLAVGAGLKAQQFCDATRALGFVPQVVRVGGRPDYFAAALHTYLLSGIPVILIMRSDNDSEGHAVTAVGFQTSNAKRPFLESFAPLRSSRLVKLYVHDDRLGPYARTDLIDPPPGSRMDRLPLKIEGEQWWLDTAIAPVYPKLRLSVPSLLHLANVTNELVLEAVGEERAMSLSTDMRYDRAGDYLSRLSGQVDAERCVPFLRSVVLSRWCAVIRWYLDERHLLDFVYDTTDTVRSPEASGAELLRALVCFDQAYAGEARVLAENFCVPWT